MKEIENLLKILVSTTCITIKCDHMQNSTNILYLLHQDDGSTLPISVAVGDKVLLPEYGGTKVNIEDQVLS